ETRTNRREARLRVRDLQRPGRRSEGDAHPGMATEYQVQGPRLPSEDALRLPSVAPEVVDLRGAEVPLVDFHVRLPIRDASDAERLFHELANRVGLARRPDEVIRLLVLEDPPHQVDELRGVSPVASRVQIPEADRLRAN